MPDSAQPYYTGEEIAKVRASDIMERRRRYLVRWTSVKAERSRHWTKWQDLADYFIPERGRFLATDHNKPKDTSRIFDTTTTRMARSLAAGLMSGVTSPARPWFNVTLADPVLASQGRVKAWLWRYNQRLRQALDLSGFYKAMAMGVYPDLVTFGTACCLMEEDPVKVFRFVPLAMGSYGLAQDGKGRVDALIYEEAWTVGELVKEFGREQCSKSVRTAWNGGLLEQYVTVLRVIEPNSEFLPGTIGRRGMKWGSAWMEIGGLNSASGAQLQPSADPAIGFLRDGGYEEFPALCPRWATTSRDVYGTGPGHDALPEAKQLMVLSKRRLLAVSKGVNPSMRMPSSLRMTKLSMLPGDPVYADTNDKIEPVFVPDPRYVEEARKESQECVQHIGQSFFVELMLMFTDPNPGEGKQPVTAEEISAKQTEKMLMLGPVLENLNEFLSQMIDRAAAIMERRGLIEPPPPEIQGMGLKVEFISILAQAQKLIGTNGLDKLLQVTGQAAQVDPSVASKINGFKFINRYAEFLGTPPDVLRDDDEAQQIVDAQHQEEQAAKQGQAMLAATEGAKNLGQADAGGGESLLSRMAGPLPAAQAGEGQ